MLFQPVELKRIEAPGYRPVEDRYRAAFEDRKAAASRLILARRAGDSAAGADSLAAYRKAQKGIDAARGEGARLVQAATHTSKFNDANYIFLSFVIRYMPAGVVGLIMAAVFGAAMTSISGRDQFAGDGFSDRSLQTPRTP